MLAWNMRTGARFPIEASHFPVHWSLLLQYHRRNRKKSLLTVTKAHSHTTLDATGLHWNIYLRHSKRTRRLCVWIFIKTLSHHCCIFLSWFFTLESFVFNFLCRLGWATGIPEKRTSSTSCSKPRSRTFTGTPSRASPSRWMSWKRSLSDRWVTKLHQDLISPTPLLGDTAFQQHLAFIWKLRCGLNRF